MGLFFSYNQKVILPDYPNQCAALYLVRIFPAARSAGFQAGKITWESGRKDAKETFFISVATSLLSGYLRSSQRTYLVRLIPATKSPALKSRAQTVDKKGTFGFRKYPFTIISSFSSRQRSPFPSFHVASFFKFMDANKRVS